MMVYVSSALTSVMNKTPFSGGSIMEYTDEKGTFIIRWAIRKNGRLIRAKNKPFKIYISRN